MVHWFRQILSHLSLLVQDVDIERELHSLEMLRYDVAHKNAATFSTFGREQ